MGSHNKGIRKLMEKLYGSKCMVEEAGIRYIPVEERKKIKGYKKFQEKITYHHIKERNKGGKKTVENGALIKEYNHVWLHSLPEEEKEKVNQQLQQYKLNIAITNGLGQTLDNKSIELEFNIDEKDCITIPVYDNDRHKQKPKKNDKRKQIYEKEERKLRKHNKLTHDDDDYEL